MQDSPDGVSSSVAATPITFSDYMLKNLDEWMDEAIGVARLCAVTRPDFTGLSFGYAGGDGTGEPGLPMVTIGVAAADNMRHSFDVTLTFTQMGRHENGAIQPAQLAATLAEHAGGTAVEFTATTVTFTVPVADPEAVATVATAKAPPSSAFCVN